MNLIHDLIGMLAFRSKVIQSRVQRASLISSFFCFVLGFFAFVTVRKTVYAELPELAGRQGDALSFFFDLNIVQALLFVSLVYIPAIMLLGKAIAGREGRISLCFADYRAHGSVLLPLWGLLLLITAPLQYLMPQFLVLGIIGISVGMFTLLTLLFVYTVWAIMHLNCLTITQALGAFCLSWFVLPIYYLIT